MQEVFRGSLKPQPPAINESSVLILDDRSILAFNTYADTYAGLEAPVNPEQGSPWVVHEGLSITMEGLQTAHVKLVTT